MNVFLHSNLKMAMAELPWVTRTFYPWNLRTNLQFQFCIISGRLERRRIIKRIFPMLIDAIKGFTFILVQYCYSNFIVSLCILIFNFSQFIL